MIIPSIDIMDGRAVQLRRGKEMILDGGDPIERMEEFSVAGEVAVVDLDAAMGRGSNTDLIRKLVRMGSCRVGGGIRDIETAIDWLDCGATRIVIGTAASPDFLSRLPRERLVAAVDSEDGRVVVEGWQSTTGKDPVNLIKELAPFVSGFLVTQVEREGGLAGFDLQAVQRAVEAAGEARVTAAGGITSPAEIATLDRMGVDAQVGVALYTGRLSLGDAVAAPLRVGIDDRLWPTVVCEEDGTALGLVWSTRESVAQAIATRQGTYWSRSRNCMWVKGATSGATQELIQIDLDCDRDALRFTVRQSSPGFCHTGARGCWSETFGLSTLQRLIEQKVNSADPNSGTLKLLQDPALLRSKLVEEAGELAAAESPGEARHEAADLLYFTLVALARRGQPLEGVMRELEARNLRLTRRPMAAKQ